MVTLSIRVHPGETEVLNGAHVNLKADRSDFLSVLRAHAGPQLLELGVVELTTLSDETHLQEDFLGTLLGNHAFISDLVVLVHLRKVAFEALVHNTFAVVRYGLDLLNVSLGNFLASLHVGLCSLAANSVNIEQLGGLCLALNLLGFLIDGRGVRRFGRDHIFARSLPVLVFLLHLVLKDLLALGVDFGRVTALLIVDSVHHFLQVLVFLHLMADLVLDKLVGISNCLALLASLIQNLLFCFSRQVGLLLNHNRFLVSLRVFDFFATAGVGMQTFRELGSLRVGSDDGSLHVLEGVKLILLFVSDGAHALREALLDAHVLLEQLGVCEELAGLLGRPVFAAGCGVDFGGEGGVILATEGVDLRHSVFNIFNKETLAGRNSQVVLRVRRHLQLVRGGLGLTRATGLAALVG